MFNSNKDFYPTHAELIEVMIEGYDLENKVILEPQGGKGDIVDFCKAARAKEVIACEIDDRLRAILEQKCRIICPDFLKVTSDQISHIDMIIMNPPFSAAVQHINHALEIAPPGCVIISLCNQTNIANTHTAARKQLSNNIDRYGQSINLGNVFKAEAERTTEADIALITMKKPGSNESEFSGFFLEDDEQQEQANGIISYNVVRDLVNRYVQAIKIYDRQLQSAVELNDTLSSFFGNTLGFQCTKNGVEFKRNDFMKAAQKAGWKFIFEKLNMEKYSTKGVKEDINKFVEKQTQIPFTMKNIYHMLDIVVGTVGSRMNKCLEEVFDKLLKHSDENRFQLEGWKTNSHYMVCRKFIIPGMTYQDQRWYKGSSKIEIGYDGNWHYMEDLAKALCYLTGKRYETIGSLADHIRYKYKVTTDEEVTFYDTYSAPYHSVSKKVEDYQKIGKANKVEEVGAIYGQWFDWGYFRCKAHKKGSMHFEFIDEPLWLKFNVTVAEIKGYQLYEHKEQTDYQKRQTGQK